MTFEDLYQSYFQDVYRFARWLGCDPSDADDLTAETFVRAWAHRQRLRTETLKAYLLTITRRLLLDQRRRQGRGTELSEQLPDYRPDPQRQASARIELERIRRVMAEWSEDDRLALVLRSEDGLSYAEIARVLELSEGAARVKVHRARRRLLASHLTDKE